MHSHINQAILFVCFESNEQFFSYLATVTILGDRATNLDLCLALKLRLLAVRVLLCAASTATWDLRFKVISEGPVILASECRALGEGAITTYF
jgi:hypothetical protein